MAPEVHRPDLAVSLNTLAHLLHTSGKNEEAFAAVDEAIHILAPFFVRLPAAYAAWMVSMARNYTECCNAYGSPPDIELLETIESVFTRMDQGKSGEGLAGESVL
jgi:hypothetical protein